MVAGTQRGKWAVTVATELGIQLGGGGLVLKTDSEAAKSFVSRRGLGRMRHIEVRELWLQEEVRKGSVKVKKVAGTENPADLMTKFLGKSEVVDKLRRMGLAWKGTGFGGRTWWAETDECGNGRMIGPVAIVADGERQKMAKGFVCSGPKGGTPHVRQDGGRFATAWAWGYPSPVNLDSIPGWQGHADPHCLLTKCQKKKNQKGKEGRKGKAKERQRQSRL